MAKLPTAIKDPVLGWYPKWMQLDEYGQPKNWIRDGMNQPPTIMIQWSTCSGKEMSCNDMPDKALFSQDYALAFTTLYFGKKLFI
jgi:hypothetical protein